MPPSCQHTGPAIVTLTTDFGLHDHYVAQVKAVLLREKRITHVVDVSHNVPPQDVQAGSILLERALDAFPAGTIHLAVVDPGVGSSRTILFVEINDQYVICPNNGLITWPFRMHGDVVRVHEMNWRPMLQSATFEARDVMAPAIVRFVGGERIAGARVDTPLLLDLAPAIGDDGQVIYIDHYGSAMTNLRADRAKDRDIFLEDRPLGPLRHTYADVPVGEPLALVGSAGFVEIAVRDGSARDSLGLRVGDRVRLGNRH